MSPLGRKRLRARNAGFTMVELVMVIVILGILSVVAVSKWPTGMKDEGARRELKRAFRYAQHKAMTRDFNPNAPWGLQITNGAYTVQRYGANCSGADASDPDKCAEEDYRNRYLLGDSSNTLSGPPGDVWFNGLGEPIDNSGNPLASSGTYLAAGLPLAFCPETGYVQEGATCP